MKNIYFYNVMSSEVCMFTLYETAQIHLFIYLQTQTFLKKPLKTIE